MPHPTPYGNAPLDPAIRSRTVEGVNGLALHVLEAGFEGGERPCVLLLHGFPELAYSWRKVMPRLAQAGYRVLAPDQRGYGLPTGWDGGYDCDLGAYGALNLVRDALALVHARHPLGGGGGRPRFRRHGRGVVCAVAARRVPLGRGSKRSLSSQMIRDTLPRAARAARC